MFIVDQVLIRIKNGQVYNVLQLTRSTMFKMLTDNVTLYDYRQSHETFTIHHHHRERSPLSLV